jgi:cellulose synthase/poly-beta-1,6-N-acetylglucosamine synthase-like glycosyltransferase
MTLLLLLFHLVYAGVLLVFRFGLFRAARLVRVGTPDRMPKATVLVPFRNEQAHLPDLINDLLKQDYPSGLLEIICIDDHSSDNGAELIAALGTRVKLIRLPDSLAGKKAALEEGVAASESEWILTTDADCRLQPDWARTLIMAGTVRDAIMVCGTVAVQPSNGILGTFQSLETHVLQRLGSSSLALGFPLLNTGASLAFRRSVFFEVGGYRANRHLASGDDTFLMLAMHAAYPGRVIPCPQYAARVTTAAESDWVTFLSQRRRRASKITHYRSMYIPAIGLILFLGQWATLAGLLLFPAGFIPIDMLLLFLTGRFLPELLLICGGVPFSRCVAAIPVSLVFPLLNLLTMLPGGASEKSWKGRPFVNKKQ